MARGQNKLTAKQVEKAPPGRHGDGGSLFLDVKAGRDGGSASKTWTFLFRSPVHRTPGKGKHANLMIGRLREMGMGLFGDGKDGSVTLAMARDKAADARKQIAAGLDPARRTPPRCRAREGRPDVRGIGRPVY